MNSKFSGCDDDNNCIGMQKDLPLKIKKGKGVIAKLCPDFGIIKSEEPVIAEIYFKPRIFGNKDIDLTSFLHAGSAVYFNAQKESYDKFKKKYYATNIWATDRSTSKNNKIIIKSRKHKEAGLCGPLNLNGEGTIQNVFPHLGFIAVRGNESNTVFFHKNCLENYKNVTDLTKIFSKEDIVEFEADRTTRLDAKAKWTATKVWKKSLDAQQKTCKSDSNQYSSRSVAKEGTENILENISFKNEDKEIDHEFSNSSVEKIYTEESKTKALKRNGSIETFHNIEGKIDRLYSTYAETKSINLQSTVPFFQNDFYFNGHSLQELELKDLRQVLKKGDTINFNFCRITEDSGEKWQFISLAWKGCKPKIIEEMSPGDFISRFNLSVTLNDVTIDSMQKCKITCEKFHNVDVVCKEDSKTPQIKSSDNEESPISEEDSNVELSKEVLSLVDNRDLVNAVCQLLKKVSLPTCSEVDLFSKAQGIIKKALERTKNVEGDSRNALSQCENQRKNISNICSMRRNNFSQLHRNSKDCGVQTIITGEIFCRKFS